jgi:hypothetical protein
MGNEDQSLMKRKLLAVVLPELRDRPQIQLKNEEQTAPRQGNLTARD